MNDFFIIATGTSPYSVQHEKTRTVSLKCYTTHTASYPSISYFQAANVSAVASGRRDGIMCTNNNMQHAGSTRKPAIPEVNPVCTSRGEPRDWNEITLVTQYKPTHLRTKSLSSSFPPLAAHTLLASSTKDHWSAAMRWWINVYKASQGEKPQGGMHV
jgi:hypothetical protein